MEQNTNKQKAFDAYKAMGSLLTLKQTVEALRQKSDNKVIRDSYIMVIDAIDNEINGLNGLADYYDRQSK